MKPDKYAFSFNEEDYTGEYDTPEEAAKEAFETDDDALRVHVGQCVKPKLEDYLDATTLLENITESNPEQFSGDWAEGWVCGLFESKAAIADLDAQLTELVKAWVEKHDLHPDFFNVEDVKTYSREEIFGKPTAE